MKNKIATAFEQIEKKTRIDAIMAKVNTTILASHESGCLNQCIDLLNQYIDEVLNHIAINCTDETE